MQRPSAEPGHQRLMGAAGSALNLLQFPTSNHRCAITQGVREPECRTLLQTFFAEQRLKQKSAN